MDSYILGTETFHSTDANLKAIHPLLVRYLQAIDPAAPASSVGVCGSYMTRSMIRPSPFSSELPAVDLYITMPNAVCSETDANDGHYDAKRVSFCNALASGLTEQGHEAASLPCPGRKNKMIVRVIPKVGELPIHIHPRVEGISDYLVKGYKKRTQYVNAILEDAAMPALLQVIHGVCASRPNYVRCILVLKAWASHVGITAAHNSPYCHSEQFQPFVFAILLCVLHKEGIVSATMSEENVLRTVWVQLTRGYVDGPKLFVSESGFPLLNVLQRSSQRFLDSIVKPAAEEALKQSSAVDVFSAPRITFPMHFSAVFRVNFSNKDEGSQILECVNYALQDRIVTAFVEIESSKNSASIFVRVRAADGRNKLLKGPSLEQTSEVDKFNQFWGSAAVSTRQFSDGSIHKCVSWVDQCLSSGRTAFGGYSGAADVMLPVADVTAVILEGALKRRLQSFMTIEQAYSHITDIVNERVGDATIDTAPLAHSNLQSASAEIIAIVTKVQSSLACKVNGFDIISGSVRECDPYPIRPHAAVTDKTTSAPLLATTPSIEPVYCVLGIDDKNKIPDTLDAIKTMKGALCAQLSNALIATGCESHCTTTSVDIISVQGYVFRIFIAHFREVSLLRALERGPQADMLERKLFWSVQHHKYVHSVLTNVHITFSKAVRLAKRWVGAMLLGDFIAPEAVELIVGRSYLVQTNKPRSAEEGFYRFLQLLAQYDWTLPLVIDPTISVDPKKVWDTEVLGMIIMAPYDIDQISPFTAHTPRPMIVHRLSMLAAGAAKAFEEGRFTSLWQCDIPSSFDLAIPLSENMALAADRCIARLPPSPSQYRLWRAGDLTGADRQRYITQLCELEPAMFCLRTLRGATREKCMIFMDVYGPQTLAVVSLSQQPSQQQLRAIASSITEAAPKGSLGDIVLPPLPVPKQKQKAKASKKIREVGVEASSPVHSGEAAPKKNRVEVVAPKQKVKKNSKAK